MPRALQHHILHFTTAGRRDVVDLTDDIDLLIIKLGMVSGTIHIKAKHTTARVLEQENEPQFHIDLFEKLDQIAPPNDDYRHDMIGTLRVINVCDGECANGWAHIQASFIPNNLTVHVFNGQRIKGRWDRVLLLEFDRSRDRDVSVVLDGEFKDSPES
ncbi:MAG: secondary thiamine-phosphate synthase enzyme YjbQ [Planctomycetota bacterium]